MSSIPLPALSVRPPAQPVDPLEQFSRLQAIRGSIMGQQLQQQQIQGATQENQIRQIQLQDTQAASQAMREWDGKDISDLPGLYLKRGASAQAILGLRGNIVDFQQKLGNAQKTDLENFKAKNDYIAGQLDSVAQLKDPAKISSALDTLGQNDDFRKMLNPQEQAQLPQIIQGLKQTAAQGGDVVGQLTELRNHHLADSQMADLAQKQQQTKTSAQQEQTSAQEQQTSAATQKKTEAETANLQQGANQAVADAKYRNLQTQLAQGQKISPEDQAWIKGYEKQKTLVPQFNFNLQNAGAAADQNGNPSEIAKAIASGQMAWKDAVSMRTPMATKNAILQQVYKLKPDFDTAEFGLEQDAAKKARSGAWADTRLAYNTALDHSDLLLQAADALKNNDFRTLNSISNRFKTEFGWSGQINYNAIANAYNHEVTSVVSKGHITDKEVSSGGATLPDNANAQTIHDVVNSYKSLMTSKRDELDKIIRAGAGEKANATIATGSNSQQGNGTFSVPAGAPAAPKEDGKVLKQAGKIVAKSQGGQWVAP